MQPIQSRFWKVYNVIKWNGYIGYSSNQKRQGVVQYEDAILAV